MRIGYAVFTDRHALVPRRRHPTAVAGLGPARSASTYRLIQAGQWWPTLFPALAIASLVIATNLVADSIEAVCAA